MSTSRTSRSVTAVLLLFAMTVAAIVIPALGVLAPFVIEEFALSRTQFGWLVTMIAAVNAATSPAVGSWTDRVGGKVAIVSLGVGIAAAAAGIALAPTVLLLVVFAGVSGLANAAGNPATNEVIARNLPPGARGTTMGLKQSGVQVGYLLVGITLPTLALAAGWRAAFLALSALSLAYAVAASRWLPKQERPADGTQRRTTARTVPAVWWLTGYAFLMGAGGSAVTTFLPLYSHEALGLHPAVAGWTIALVGGVGVVARVILARDAERRASYALPLALLAWGAAFAVAVLVSAAAWTPFVWFGAAVAGCSVVAWNAVANLAAVAVAEDGRAGRASGVVNLGFMGGFTLGPVGFGALADLTTTYVVAWTAPLGLFAFSAVAMHTWWLRSRRGRLDGPGGFEVRRGRPEPGRHR